MPKNFTIVGIGASAGGIQALEQFFQTLPNNLGLTYIVIMHLAPDRESNLEEILQKKTKMVVKSVEQGIKIKPNQIYVIPPNRELSIKNHTLNLSEFESTQRHCLPIDHFFRSLAREYKKNAIGILFSGTGSDGTQGLREIKGLGGITIVQDPETASYQEMLMNAIGHVDVDIIMAPSEIAIKLAQYKDNIQKILKLEKSLKNVDVDNEELRTVNEGLSTKNQELSKLNNDLNNIISSTPIGIIFLDTELNIQRYTPKITGILNLIPTDIGRPLYHISSNLTFQIKDLVTAAKEVLDELVPIEKDVQTENNNWYTMKITPYRTIDNVIKGIVIIFVDITERKLGEENLKKSEEDANFAYRKSEFYRSLFTHDISNILQVILSTVNLIEHQEIICKEKDGLNEFFGRIQEQIIKARTLLKDIQQISYLEKKMVDTISIDLIEYLDQSIDALKILHPQVNYEIEFNPRYQKVKVSGAKILEDCFQNILDNSITYNESEIKRIVIKIDELKKGDKEYVRVCFEDNGVGISKQLKKKIIKENYNNTNGNYIGLGIGLSLVKRTLELINGEFIIEDRVKGDYKKGTRIILLIPKISVD